MSARDLTFSRNLLRRFIALYRESPCLWNRKCLTYKHKQKRNEAIARLTELVRKHDPTATKVHVLRKIESMRACVRREHKKVLASAATAKSEDEVYVPHLWYYNLLAFAFIDELDETKLKVEFQPEDDIDSDNPDIGEDNFEFSSTSYPDYSISTKILEVPDSSVQKHNDDDNKRKQHCTEVDDEYDAIGINVAAKLRGLPSSMRILAEKLINDVLFQAQTNALTSSTVVTTPDPFKS